jgi:hypothetical protein
MTVVFKTDEQKFTAREVLWSNKMLIDSMVKTALVGQTEAFLDMIMDATDHVDRTGINNTLLGVKDSAQEFIDDMMLDLKRALTERMKQARYGAAVTGLKFNLSGDVKDIEVNLSIVFEE